MTTTHKLPPQDTVYRHIMADDNMNLDDGPAMGEDMPEVKIEDDNDDGEVKIEDDNNDGEVKEEAIEICSFQDQLRYNK